MMKIKNIEFETNFTIMPTQTNYMTPLIFGGAFFSELDLAAASCVSRALHGTECNSAVTYKFDGTFHKPTYAGEIIFIFCKIIALTNKSLTVETKAYREKRNQEGRDFVAEATFVFVSKKDGNFVSHGLTFD